MKGTTGKSWTWEKAEKRRDLVAKMTRLGVPGPIIAAHLGVSVRTVSRARRERDCAKPLPTEISEADLAVAQQMLEDGATYSEVSRTLGRDTRVWKRRFPGFDCPPERTGELSMLARTLNKIPSELHKQQPFDNKPIDMR